MLNTLSTPIADTYLAPKLHCSRDRLSSAGSAVKRTVMGFAFIGVLAAASEVLGPAGLPVACILAALAIGEEFLTTAQRRHDG